MPSALQYPSPALEARNLSVARGNRAIFRDINLALYPGEIVALLGANGAGKTTLLHCLAGALRPAGGEVFWQGQPCRRGPAARNFIGLVGHESGLYVALTASENLIFAGRMSGLESPRKRAAEVLALIGLEGQAMRLASQLSRGMRQRLAIARALIHDPAVILLDEPFTGLDSDGRRWLTALLGELRHGKRALILTTHEPGMESGMATRVVRLDTDGLREMGLCARNA